MTEMPQPSEVNLTITELDITALAKHREAKIDKGLVKNFRWNQRNETIRDEVDRLIDKIYQIQTVHHSLRVNTCWTRSQDDIEQLVAYEDDMALFKCIKAMLIRKWYNNLHLQAEHLRLLQCEKIVLLNMENFARSTLNLEEAQDWDINIEPVEPDPERHQEHGVDEEGLFTSPPLSLSSGDEESDEEAIYFGDIF